MGRTDNNGTDKIRKMILAGGFILTACMSLANSVFATETTPLQEQEPILKATEKEGAKVVAGSDRKQVTANLAQESRATLKAADVPLIKTGPTQVTINPIHANDKTISGVAGPNATIKVWINTPEIEAITTTADSLGKWSVIVTKTNAIITGSRIQVATSEKFLSFRNSVSVTSTGAVYVVGEGLDKGNIKPFFTGLIDGDEYDSYTIMGKDDIAITALTVDGEIIAGNGVWGTSWDSVVTQYYNGFYARTNKDAFTAHSFYYGGYFSKGSTVGFYVMSHGTTDYFAVKYLNGKFVPTVNPISNVATKVTGIGTAGEIVTVTLPNGSKFNGIVDSKGSFSVNIPIQRVGASISVNIKNSTGDSAPTTDITVGDYSDVLSTPTTNPYYYDESPDLIVNPNSKYANQVTLFVDGEEKRTSTYKTSSNYFLIYAGDIPEGKKFEIQTENIFTGQKSPKVNGRVLRRLKAPVINPFKPTETYVTGKVSDTSGTSVVLYDSKGIILDTKTPNVDGTYKFNVSDMVGFKTLGTEFSVAVVQKEGDIIFNQGPKKYSIVNTLYSSPILDKTLVGRVYATGRIETGADDVIGLIDANGNIIRTAKGDFGIFTIYIGDVASKLGDTFRLASINTQGSIPVIWSELTTGKIESWLAAPTINSTAIGKINATGTDRVGLIDAQGKVLRAVPINEDGTYTIYIGDVATKAGDSFRLASVVGSGYTAKIVGEKATGKIQNFLAAPTIIPTVVGKINATGKAAIGTERIGLIDSKGNVFRTVPVAKDGTYMIYIGDVATKIGDTFQLASVVGNGITAQIIGAKAAGKVVKN